MTVLLMSARILNITIDNGCAILRHEVTQYTTFVAILFNEPRASGIPCRMCVFAVAKGSKVAIISTFGTVGLDQSELLMALRHFWQTL